jgi:hypothetical protein
MDHLSVPLTRRRLLEILGAGAASLALAGCGDGPTSEPGTASGPAGGTGAGVAGKRVRVAAFKNNHAAGPLFWPQFAPEGLDVEVTTLTSGTDMNRALEADDLDFAIFGIVNGFIESEQGLGSARRSSPWEPARAPGWWCAATRTWPASRTSPVGGSASRAPPSSCWCCSPCSTRRGSTATATWRSSRWSTTTNRRHWRRATSTPSWAPSPTPAAASCREWAAGW